MAAPPSPLPSLATPGTSSSTFTRRSAESDRDFQYGAPLQQYSKQDGAMLRIDEIQRHEMEVAEVKRYPGKTKWGLLLIFSVSQVGHKASTFGLLTFHSGVQGHCAHEQYMDIASRASAVVFIGDISRDLSIDYEASTWILVCFSPSLEVSTTM